VSADRVISLTTPENVSIDFELAGSSPRLIAFAIDVAIVLTMALMLFLAVQLIGLIASVPSGVRTAVFGALFFLLRSFYFAWTELRFHGRTPGKRATGMRVIARDGGLLTGGQVIARNLTRELELFLPITVIFWNDALMPGAPVWVWLASAAWAVLLLGFPMLHRERARVGDLIAGTVVVKAPQPKLLPDLALKKTRAHAFTRAQLDLYGIRELQVLEDILRRAYPEEELLRQITDRIVSKTGWEGEVADFRGFLEDFYAAQRSQLESRMLMGDRREEKVR